MSLRQSLFGILLLSGAALIAAAPASAQAPDTRVLHTWNDVVKTDDGQEAFRRYVVSYTYSTNTATEHVYDESGNLVSESRMDAPPDPNDEEISDAIAVISADRELAAFVAQPGMVVEGGFLNYEGECQRTRCLQFEIGPADGTRVDRFVVVDLSSRDIVERDLFPHLRD